VPCLTLTLEELNELPGHLPQKPYKWIRFAIGVVVGAEGVLSTSRDSLNVVDYDVAPPVESTNLYYHISDKERERVFPVDPDVMRTHITSSEHTERRDKFRDDVAKRDGWRCVLTRWEARYCDAVHLLAHSKNDPVHYFYFQSSPTHYHNHGSTLQVILSTAVELEPTL